MLLFFFSSCSSSSAVSPHSCSSSFFFHLLLCLAFVHSIVVVVVNIFIFLFGCSALSLFFFFCLCHSVSLHCCCCLWFLDFIKETMISNERACVCVCLCAIHTHTLWPKPVENCSFDLDVRMRNVFRSVAATQMYGLIALRWCRLWVEWGTHTISFGYRRAPVFKPKYKIYFMLQPATCTTSILVGLVACLLRILYIYSTRYSMLFAFYIIITSYTMFAIGAHAAHVIRVCTLCCSTFV